MINIPPIKPPSASGRVADRNSPERQKNSRDSHSRFPFVERRKLDGERRGQRQQSRKGSALVARSGRDRRRANNPHPAIDLKV